MGMCWMGIDRGDGTDRHRDSACSLGGEPALSQEPDIQQLMRDAITAAREGDKERARILFEEIVAQDPQNEKAWFWLASVAETDEERRVYLGNVVQINPNNERAQALLAKLEARQEHRPKSSLDEEIAPGITRRLAIIGGTVVGLLAVVICAAIVLVITSNQQATANQQGLGNHGAVARPHDRLCRAAVRD